MVDDDLWDLWAAATIDCEVDGRRRILRGSDAEALPADPPIFAITAYNPMGVERDRALNEADQRKLEGDLRAIGVKFWPANGQSPDGSWWEPGFAAAGLDRAGACELGSRYGQLAIYELDENEAHVVRCVDQEIARTRLHASNSELTVREKCSHACVPRDARPLIAGCTESVPAGTYLGPVEPHGQLPSANVDVDRQIVLLTAGAVDVISEADLRKKLETGRPLRVKLGIDPTASDIHLGFAVVLRRLRRFQDLGHVAVLIIGDFTAMVGDPSGKSVTRPRLSKDEVDAHAQSYIEQATRILDPAPERLEIVRNSTWLSALDMEAVLQMTSQVTVARMLERDDFANRYQSGVAISLMEFLYPLLQATDSVEIKADVELGGADQLFNLIMGRHLQSRAGQDPQIVLTTPLLVGLDGEQKMSKSLDNYVGIAEPASEQFGKIMSIADEMMPAYFRYATDWPPERVTDVLAELVSGDLHPNAAKRMLGRAVVDLYHGPGAGEAAEAEFDRIFKAHAQPEEVPEVTITGDVPRKLSQWLVLLGLAASNREAARQLRDGAVKIDGVPVGEDREYTAAELEGRAIQNGKRKWARLRANVAPTEGG